MSQRVNVLSFCETLTASEVCSVPGADQQNLEILHTRLKPTKKLNYAINSDKTTVLTCDFKTNLLHRKSRCKGQADKFLEAIC